MIPKSFSRITETPIGGTFLLFCVAAFFTATLNGAFWRHVQEAYPWSAANAGFLISLAAAHAGLVAILLLLTCFRRTLKPFLGILLVLSAAGAYFMDQYDVLIDQGMLQNAAETDLREAYGLFSFRLIAYLIFLGALPSLLIAKLRVRYRPLWRECTMRLLTIAGIVASILALIWIFSEHYGSFFREHKAIRQYANPLAYVIAGGEAAKPYLRPKHGPLKAIGENAHIPADDVDRELIIFVVGETTRADRFSLNGYTKETNPLLAKEEVISFTNVWSCGTSTIVSVPCMFSNIEEEDFSRHAAASIENVMDVLKHAGVNTLWRDNNSSSKGVAERMEYQPYMSPDVNTICDTECRDEGMLVGLQDYIDAHPKGDIAIVLHQMGSHGPAYYQRYPKAFEKFKPACHTNELKDCTPEALNNAYDNTILYTDYFLSKVIALLKRNDQAFETAMFFVGDHGESLGENGIYLHGMPLMLAPDAQRHVPMIIWLGARMDSADRNILMRQRTMRYTHENVFHTLLGFMEIDTDVYDAKKSILSAQP